MENNKQQQNVRVLNLSSYEAPEVKEVTIEIGFLGETITTTLVDLLT